MPFGTALAGWPVGAAESGSRCVLSGMARGYGRVVPLRQLPTSCCHDAVAFGSRPVNDRPDGDFHPAEWTPSQAYECARLLALLKQRTAAGDLLPHSCFPQTTGLSGDPTTHTVGGTRFTPARGWVYSNRREGPEDSKAAPAEPLPHEAAEVAGGRQKIPSELVGSPQNDAIDFLNNPPHSRDFCRSEPPER